MRQVISNLQRLAQRSRLDFGDAADSSGGGQQLGRGEGRGDEIVVRAVAKQRLVTDDDVASNVDDRLVGGRQVPVEGARDHRSVTFELAVNQLRGIAHP